MMLNTRRTLIKVFGILFIFFVPSATIAQQTDTDKIIKAIHELETNMLKAMHELETKFGDQMHELELKMRDHVDTKFGELDTKFNKLNKEVAVLKSDFNKLFWFLTAIGAPVFVHFLILILSKVPFWRNNDKVVSEVASENKSDAKDYLSDDNYMNTV